MNKERIQKGEIIEVDLNNVEDIIEKAKMIAEKLTGNQTKTQIRKILGMLRTYERNYFRKEKNYEKLLEELKFMKPKMVYQVARNNKIKNLEKPLLSAIDQINKANVEKFFPRLIRFMEAVVAYYEDRG